MVCTKSLLGLLSFYSCDSLDIHCSVLPAFTQLAFLFRFHYHFAFLLESNYLVGSLLTFKH